GNLGTRGQRRQPGRQGRELRQLAELLLARRAAPEVRTERRRLGGAELPVDEQADVIAADRPAHGVPPATSRKSNSRSRLRARRIRVPTVAVGIPRRAEISWYDRRSTSLSSYTARNSASSRSSAARSCSGVIAAHAGGGSGALAATSTSSMCAACASGRA